MASACSARLVFAAPRSYLFTRPTANLTRPFSSVSARLQDRSFKPADSSNAFDGSKRFGGIGAGPSPPRLPKEEQEIFEALQRQSTGAFSTPRSPPQINQSPDSNIADRAEAETEITDRAEKLAAGGQDAQGLSQPQQQSKFKDDFDRVIEARGRGEELHPNVRRGAQPEFEGDTNPKTGEVGGPKNDPLRWGASGEWTYNGRATDF